MSTWSTWFQARVSREIADLLQDVVDRQKGLSGTDKEQFIKDVRAVVKGWSK